MKKQNKRHLLGMIPAQGKSKEQLVEEAIKLLESKGVRVQRDQPSAPRERVQIVLLPHYRPKKKYRPPKEIDKSN